MTAWAVIAGLILVNAFYVAAEFGAVGVRRTRVAALADEGQYLARLLLPVVEDARLLDRHIAATQIGITISSLLLGAYGQASLSPLLGPIIAARADVDPITAQSLATGAILVALTIAQVIFGELVPKSIALQYPTPTALYTVVPMRWSSRAFAWLINTLNGASNVLLRVVGLPSLRHRHVHSPEEIDLLIVESRDGGLLEPEEQHRLHRALRLGLRTVRQLMVPRAQMRTLAVETPFDEALRLVAETTYTRLPVYRGTLDNVVGVLHTHDVALRLLGVLPHADSIDKLLRPVLKVAETLGADRLLKLFRERRVHQAIVIDQNGCTTGLVTLEDVLGELLGDVADELKPTAPPERRA